MPNSKWKLKKLGLEGNYKMKEKELKKHKIKQFLWDNKFKLWIKRTWRKNVVFSDSGMLKYIGINK